MKMRKKIIPLAVLIGFLMIGSSTVPSTYADNTEEESLDPIPTRNYYAKKYNETNAWCCYDGTTGCVPSNCP